MPNFWRNWWRRTRKAPAQATRGAGSLRKRPFRPEVRRLEDRLAPSTGGGFLNGGLTGQYYNNTSLVGSPVFTRQDVRIDFNWNTGLAVPASVSGSTAYPLAAENFSVSWTGQFIPNYSETYTFSTATDGGVRLFVSQGPINTQTQKPLIADWNLHALTTDTASITLQAGQTYYVEMDYYEGTRLTGAAHLSWSSPSTPQEIIDPATPLGINLEASADWDGLIPWANVMHDSRRFGSTTTPWDASAPVDANGWPTQDFGAVVLDPPGGVPSGTYFLSFNGLAQTIKTVASSATIQNLVYNAATNTTTADLIVPAESTLDLAFIGTQRTQTSPVNSGLTNVQLMMPTSPGSTTPYASNVVFNTAMENLIEPFTAIRFMDYSATNGSTQVNWSDRTIPSQARYIAGPWEYAVMLANETGKDMWINIPEEATDAYVTDLANLIRYGSDGVNPYTSPQANPVFPGLNSNLKVYVEFSNEVWNYSFPQATQNLNAAEAEVAAGNSPLNYDGSTDPTQWARRRVGERLVQISNDFRAVFGDSQMGTRIRPVLEWQYGNDNNTASDPLNFINNYYDNADGVQHVANPEPVNYFLWGGGGGWYFSNNNTSGSGDVTVPDSSFETATVSGYQPDPTGSPWTFSGSAGIAANGSALGNPNAPNGTQAAYLQGTGSFSETVTFTGGQAALSFYAAEGSTGSESFKVYVDGTPVGSAWTPANSSYALYNTLSFNTTSGTHTIQFVGQGGNGTVFVDQVQVEDANAMYNSGLTDPYGTVAADAQWAHAFGLNVTNYEGGFTIGGDSPTDLQKQANLDPRAQQSEASGIARVFQAGSNLAMVYDSSGYNAYGLADPNIFDQDTPKLQAIQQLLSQAPAAPTNGTELPTTGGQSVTIAEDTNYISPGASAARIYLLLASAPGTYSVTIHGTQDDPGTVEHFTLDGKVIPGLTSLPASSGGAGNSNPALTFTVSTAGMHALTLYVDGPSRIHLDGGNVTITAGAGPALPPAPAAPSNLLALATSFAQVNLTWSDNSSNERGFRIERSTDGVHFTLIAVVGANVTSYVDNTVSPSTSYTYRVRAYNAGGYSAYAGPASAATPAAVVPPPWSDTDIGNPGMAGFAGYNATSGTWTVAGGGADIWGNSDQFNYLSQSWSGDGALVAQVTSVANTDPWAKAGVMFRASTAANAMFVDVVVTPGDGVAFQYRNAAGQLGSVQASGAAPLWVKLVRAGNNFTGYYSTDGSTWKQIGSTQTIAMGSSALAGLAVTAHNNATRNTSTFSGVSITAPNQAPAVATPAAASPSPVTGTTTNLSVLGATYGGEGTLNYTWAALGTPPAPVSFSANGTNAAKNTIVTFRAAGTYMFQVTITDAGGRSTTQTVTVTVLQTLTSITVSPTTPTVAAGGTGQFTAVGKDQFGNLMTSPPSFTWSVVSGGGTIDSTGRYVASQATGPVVVRASAGSASGTATLTVIAALPTSPSRQSLPTG